MFDVGTLWPMSLLCTTGVPVTQVRVYSIMNYSSRSSKTLSVLTEAVKAPWISSSSFSYFILASSPSICGCQIKLCPPTNRRSRRRSMRGRPGSCPGITVWWLHLFVALRSFCNAFLSIAYPNHDLFRKKPWRHQLVWSLLIPSTSEICWYILLTLLFNSQKLFKLH